MLGGLVRVIKLRDTFFTLWETADLFAKVSQPSCKHINFIAILRMELPLARGDGRIILYPAGVDVQRIPLMEESQLIQRTSLICDCLQQGKFYLS